MKKRGNVGEYLPPWIIAIIVLALVLGLYMILGGKGKLALDALRNILKFR